MIVNNILILKLGVKFGLIKLDNGPDKRRIQIQAESMEYNYTSGELVQGTEEWTKPSSDNHEYF